MKLERAAILCFAAFLAATALAVASAAEPASPAAQLLDVHALTDITAALECYSKGYRYMLRLGHDDVVCLRTAVAAKRAVDIEKTYPGLRCPALSDAAR